MWVSARGIAPKKEIFFTRPKFVATYIGRDMLTQQAIVKALPPQFKNSVSTELVDTLNNITQDEILAENIRDNFISYAGVMKDGKFKMQDYSMLCST